MSEEEERAAASFRDPAYLSSLSKIWAVLNNIWLLDEEPGRLEDEAKCGLMKPLGCLAQCRLLLTNPRGQHSTSLQAQPWPWRCSHPHLNPSDPVSTLTMNLSAVGGNAVWGVSGTAMPGKPYYCSVEGLQEPWWAWAAAPTHSSLQRYARHQGKGMKYSEKAFKSKLNPINDSFKRSIPSIYKSTLMGLCAIWLPTFAVSHNPVQAPWALTNLLPANSSLSGIWIKNIFQWWLLV